MSQTQTVAVCHTENVKMQTLINRFCKYASTIGYASPATMDLLKKHGSIVGVIAMHGTKDDGQIDLGELDFKSGVKGYLDHFNIEYPVGDITTLTREICSTQKTTSIYIELAVSFDVAKELIEISLTELLKMRANWNLGVSAKGLLANLHDIRSNLLDGTKNRARVDGIDDFSDDIPF